MQKSVISAWNTSLNGSQSSPVVLDVKQRLLGQNNKSMDPSPHLLFLDAKQQLLDQNNKSLLVPDITYRLMYAKQRD